MAQKAKAKVRVLFLDVDGVLHPASDGIQFQVALGSEEPYSLSNFATGEYGLFRPRAMNCLARILVCSGARVVLSSAWRALPGGRQAVDLVLRRWGLPPVYSCTPGEGADRRVERIWSWLAEHRDQVEGYAVVDDMDLSLETDYTGFRTQPSCIAGHFVRTPSAVGLTSGHVARLLAKLQKEPTLPEDSEGIGALLPLLPKTRKGTIRAASACFAADQGRSQKEIALGHARARTSRRLERMY
mmetsp:Transcript_57356/g.134259  ORF Transcript_57356/g.134259 Transcript_57356/m.134259 type:complete len:242 (-) Transcript_57356:70-795(-)